MYASLKIIEIILQNNCKHLLLVLLVNVGTFPYQQLKNLFTFRELWWNNTVLQTQQQNAFRSSFMETTESNLRRITAQNMINNLELKHTSAVSLVNGCLKLTRSEETCFFTWPTSACFALSRRRCPLYSTYIPQQQKSHQLPGNNNFSNKTKQLYLQCNCSFYY